MEGSYERPRPHAPTTLAVGGLGGLGSLVVSWLAQSGNGGGNSGGASVAVGRTGRARSFPPLSSSSSPSFSALSVAFRADTSSSADCALLFSSFSASLSSYSRIHAAVLAGGSVADAPLPRVSPADPSLV